MLPGSNVQPRCRYNNPLTAKYHSACTEADDLAALIRKGIEVVLWSHLPIFGKFLGDGVLLLWDVTDITREARRNIVQAFDVICNDYEKVFLKQIKGVFTRPPSKCVSG